MSDATIIGKFYQMFLEKVTEFITNQTNSLNKNFYKFSWYFFSFVFHHFKTSNNIIMCDNTKFTLKNLAKKVQLLIFSDKHVVSSESEVEWARNGEKQNIKPSLNWDHNFRVNGCFFVLTHIWKVIGRFEQQTVKWKLILNTFYNWTLLFINLGTQF